MENQLQFLMKEIKTIEKKIGQLYENDPIFGLITKKYVKCGKKNCKCRSGAVKDMHGPYYYLRIEPDYKYKKYLGKRLPEEIMKRVSIGNEIKKLEAIRERLIELKKELEKTI